MTVTQIPFSALSPRKDTLAGLLDQLGGISADRVLRSPAPGTANEDDFLHANEQLEIPCELIDGTLVAKAMGSYEALVATFLSNLLWNFIRPRKMGIVIGADSMFRLFGGNIRMPDVAFVPKERFQEGLPKGPFWKISPTLVVEVLSASNTAAEMDRKRSEFFASGVLLMWVVDPERRGVTIYRPEQSPVALEKADTLYAIDVLPGFSLPLVELFSVMDL